MDFENINLEKIIIKGKIPDNNIYNKKKIVMKKVNILLKKNFYKQKMI